VVTCVREITGSNPAADSLCVCVIVTETVGTGCTLLLQRIGRLGLLSSVGSKMFRVE